MCSVEVQDRDWDPEIGTKRTFGRPHERTEGPIEGQAIRSAGVLRARAHRGWLNVGLVLLAAAILSALTWFGTLTVVTIAKREARARVEAEVATQALLFESQLRRELLAVDQTLRILEHEWEASPGGFDLQAWFRRALVLDGLPLHVFITDASGIIRASTRPELIGVDVSGRDYFRDKAGRRRDDGRMFVGPTTLGLVTHRSQMNMARRLDGPDDRFLGVIGLSYDVGSLTRLYHQADLGANGMVAIVGTRDARLRALAGPSVAAPGLDISGTPMLAALRGDPKGRWTGPSAPDGVRRVHAFRLVPNRDLAVVVAFDAASAMRASSALVTGAQVVAVAMTLFILVMTAILLRAMRVARGREARLRRDQATLAAANTELDASRRRADAKAAQLEATLAGMSDGVSMLDADLRLVAWNDVFASFTGVPADLLRVGTPMQELLRAQARTGEFGPVDIEADVARRIGLLRSGAAVGTVERQRPNGHTLELRRRAIPGGGFVTLYTDVTTRKQAEAAIRRARELAEAATEAKSRLVATVSHEIRTPLNTLLNSLRLLQDSANSPPQRQLISMARHAGDGLLGLINDVLEMSRMEAGRLSLRPTRFALHPMLDGLLQQFRHQAGAGQHLSLAIGSEVPDFVFADSGRIRQIMTNFLSNAVAFAGPGQIALSVELQSRPADVLLRLTLRDPGPVLSVPDRARIFQPFSRLDRPRLEAVSGTGLGLAICEGLASLMQGEIGCAPSPQGGNDFWLVLPIDLTRGQAMRVVSGAQLPRTRILLVEDVLPNQLVTATLLRREGHMVDVAGSGEAALQARAGASYDVVLMDVSMPGMSGLEATRRIRASRPPVASLPIIALTANVAHADRARCRDAGMQDLVEKPVEIARVIEVIARHVWFGRAAVPVSGGVTDEMHGRITPTLSPERIFELRSSLSRSTVIELAKGCLVELRTRASDLNSSICTGDADLIGQHAHAMAGLSASYGMVSLEQRLRSVMGAARAGDIARARAHGAGLNAELDRAAPVLLAALGEAAMAG